MDRHLGGAVSVASSTPYPWPFDGDLAGPGTVVLVVQPAAPWPGQVDDAVVASAAEVAAAVRAAGGDVVGVLTAPPPSHAAGPPTAGLPTGSVTVEAAGVDGFYGSSLESRLRAGGARRLVLVGLGAETTIHSTMRTANDMGYECLFVRDACQPYDATLARATVSMIEMSGGIFGAVADAGALVAAVREGNVS